MKNNNLYKRVRADLGISVAKMVKFLGMGKVSERAISRWENNHQTPMRPVTILYALLDMGKITAKDVEAANEHLAEKD